MNIGYSQGSAEMHGDGQNGYEAGSCCTKSGPCRARTDDQRIKSPTLYQLS